MSRVWSRNNLLNCKIKTVKTENRDKIVSTTTKKTRQSSQTLAGINKKSWNSALGCVDVSLVIGLGLDPKKESILSLDPLRLNQDRVSTIHKVSRVSDFGLDVLRLEIDLDFDQLQLFYRDLQSCRTTILFCNKKTFNLSAFKNE